MKEKRNVKMYNELYRKLLRPQIIRIGQGNQSKAVSKVLLNNEYQLGDRIADRYEIIRILGGEGKSGMGVVYVCFDNEVKNVIALKTVQNRFLASDKMKDAFKRQALACIRAQSHPNILKTRWFQELDGRMFLASEYVAPDGEGRSTLTHYLYHPISFRQVLTWSIQFCHGMEYACAKGVTPHRNIKPDALLIAQDGRVKIGDFALAGVRNVEPPGDPETTTDEGDTRSSFLSRLSEKFIAGTPPWMAPEQFEGQADVRSDIYSFGIVLYQMINKGTLPFWPQPGINLSEWSEVHRTQKVSKVDSPLFPIIAKCIEKDRHKRFKTFTELRKVLEQLFVEEFTRKTSEPLPVPVEESGPSAWEYNDRGVSLANLGLIDDAILEYRNSVRIDPRYAIPYYNIGLALQDKGCLAEAIESYREALRLDPDYIAANIGIGMALKEKGNLSLAIEAFNKVLCIYLKYKPMLYNSEDHYRGMDADDISKDIHKIYEKTHLTAKSQNVKSPLLSIPHSNTSMERKRRFDKERTGGSLLGETIDGFKILKVIGRGGFAIIYLAEDTRTKQMVAIKFAKSDAFAFKEDLGKSIVFQFKSTFAKMVAGNSAVPLQEITIPFENFDKAIPQRFTYLGPQMIEQILESEGIALKDISHPSFVKVIGEGRYHGISYLALEYIDGCRLRDLINLEGKIPLRFFCEIIDGLIEAAQKGMEYHGDLKPENIMITKDFSVKIIDPSSKIDLDGVRITTPHYNPFLGADDKTSLGVMLYEISTGFLPFPYSTMARDFLELKTRVNTLINNYIKPSYLNPDMPEGLERVINRALNLERKRGVSSAEANGYDSLHEIKMDLENIISSAKTSYLEVSSNEKTDAIIRVISSGFLVNQPETLKKVINFIINYSDPMKPTIVSRLGSDGINTEVEKMS